jgi:hypothetical protein
MDKPSLCVSVACEVGRKELERDAAVESEIVSRVDHAHSSAAEEFQDFVV